VSSARAVEAIKCAEWNELKSELHASVSSAVAMTVSSSSGTTFSLPAAPESSAPVSSGSTSLVGLGTEIGVGVAMGDGGGGDGGVAMAPQFEPVATEVGLDTICSAVNGIIERLKAELDEEFAASGRSESSGAETGAQQGDDDTSAIASDVALLTLLAVVVCVRAFVT
jgi:hypothetical protein